MPNSSIERLELIWNSYKISERLKGARFDNYIPGSPGQEKALEKCVAFTREGVRKIEKGQGLFITGPVGSGKSHLAVAALHEIVSKNIEQFGFKSESDIKIYGEPEYHGKLCSVISVVDLLDTLRAGFDSQNGRGKAGSLLSRARTDDILILDDIGAEKPSAWVEEQLYALIDIRYRMNRSTIFTTNLSVKELEFNIGPRSVSRIIDMTEGVKVEGKDWRKKRLSER